MRPLSIKDVMTALWVGMCVGIVLGGLLVRFLLPSELGEPKHQTGYEKGVEDFKSECVCGEVRDCPIGEACLPGIQSCETDPFMRNRWGECRPTWVCPTPTEEE